MEASVGARQPSGSARRIGARSALTSWPQGDYAVDGLQTNAFTVTASPHTYNKLNSGSTVSILQPTSATVTSQDATTATIEGPTGRYMVQETTP